MSKLDKAIVSMNSMSVPSEYPVSAPAILVVTLLYLVAVLSVPVSAPQKVIWLAIYPVVSAEMTGLGFGKIFLKSLWILPLIAFIGIFNPIFDRTEAFTIGGVTVSGGWVSFTGILLRGMLAVQAVIILTLNAGFYGMCESLRRLGCPRILTTQLLLTYRYMGVVMEEARGMAMARKARGFGKESYPLKMWGRMVGQLLLRSVDRAGRIHNAMKARGFSGTIISGRDLQMTRGSWAYLIGWSAAIAALRFIDFSTLITRL